MKWRSGPGLEQHCLFTKKNLVYVLSQTFIFYMYVSVIFGILSTFQVHTCSVVNILH